MKKHFVVLFIALISAISGCSEKSRRTEDRSGDHAFGRVTAIDLAFACWYAEQLGAASQLEYVLDVDFGPIHNGRDPDDILDEQRKRMAEVNASAPRGKAELHDALRRWGMHQTNAANCLRNALAMPAFKGGSAQDSDSVLDVQLADVACLKRELVDLGHPHWEEGVETLEPRD